MRVLKTIPVDSDSLFHILMQLPLPYNLEQWYSVKSQRGGDWEIAETWYASRPRLLARQRTAFVTMTGRTIYAGYRNFIIDLQKLSSREVYGRANRP